MREALATLSETVDDVLVGSAWALSDAELLAVLDMAGALRRKVDALVLGLVHEADGRGLPQRQGATSTTAWLRHRHRMTGRAARLAVTDAQRLDTAPDPLRQAVTTGAVSIDQARVIADTVATVRKEAGAVAADKTVGILLDWAREFDPDGLRRLAHRILDHVAPHLAEDTQRKALDAEDARGRRDRYLTLSPTGDGRLRLSGLLDRETSALLRTALDPLTKPHTRDDTRNPGQRRHDALADICRLTLRTGDLPDSGGEPTQVVVTTSYDPLTHTLRPGLLDTGDAVTAESVRRLACDAGILPAVLNGDGQVLNMGRQRRLFTGAVRRALALRDGGCAFPGCDRPPRWTQAHHIVHWTDGGPTNLDNGVLLCGHHHRTVHHDGWQVQPIPGGRPHFIPPPWIDPQQHPRHNTYHQRC
ncbi:DUF222 domain-containing protein [Plantactinospora sp. GCM10030261]|uniref:HNH endonuclease signature motif containing protein n=1 Tax=Plantactinospora sp. GCM10030261 TaxID=3273420 RepID=UPI003615E2B6